MAASTPLGIDPKKWKDGERSDCDESCVCYIKYYQQNGSQLTVTVLSGTLRVGMKVSTVGKTCDRDWSGTIHKMIDRGPGSVEIDRGPCSVEIEEAEAGIAVLVSGPSDEMLKMSRGIYIVSGNVEKEVYPYIAEISRYPIREVSVRKGVMKRWMKKGYPLDRIFLREANPHREDPDSERVGAELAQITDGVKVASASSNSDNHKILWPGDVVKIYVSCWHPLNRLQLMFGSCIIGRAKLDNPLIKGIPT